MRQLEVEELRVGNNVQVAGGNIVELTLIHKDDVGCHSSSSDYRGMRSFKSIYPVKVTKQLFKQLTEDFEMDKEYEHFEGRELFFMKNKYAAIHLELTGDDRISVYFGTELIQFCEYIHEIQNLFYALTKHQLKLKV